MGPQPTKQSIGWAATNVGTTNGIEYQVFTHCLKESCSRGFFSAEELIQPFNLTINKGYNISTTPVLRSLPTWQL